MVNDAIERLIGAAKAHAQELRQHAEADSSEAGAHVARSDADRWDRLAQDACAALARMH